MIALILEEGWEHKRYIEKFVEGFDAIRPWFKGVDIRAAIEVCALDFDQVRALCETFDDETVVHSYRSGIYDGATEHHEFLSLSRFSWPYAAFSGSRGQCHSRHDRAHGDAIRTRGSEDLENDGDECAARGCGIIFPCGDAEEIIAITGTAARCLRERCNPLRAYPDTSRLRGGLIKTDLLVVSDFVMSETARCAHYVLPCRSYYESWDTTFFPLPMADIYMQLRRPIVEPPANA
jgi:hypothetical protein